MIYFVIYNCFSSYLMAKSRSVDLLLLCYHLYSYEPIIKMKLDLKKRLGASVQLAKSFLRARMGTRKCIFMHL